MLGWSRPLWHRPQLPLQILGRKQGSNLPLRRPCRRTPRCTISFCHKCLLNRKKQGLKPTGLVHTAKEGGFGSVSEMLTARGPENFGIERKVADKEAVNGKENFVDQKMKAPRPRLCPPCSPRPLPSGSSTSIVALSSILGAGTFMKTHTFQGWLRSLTLSILKPFGAVLRNLLEEQLRLLGNIFQEQNANRVIRVLRKLLQMVQLLVLLWF